MLGDDLELSLWILAEELYGEGSGAALDEPADEICSLFRAAYGSHLQELVRGHVACGLTFPYRQRVVDRNAGDGVDVDVQE